MRIECKINGKADLNRQVVKAETASLRLVELDFEIPANTQRGLLNTVEGFLMKSIEDLSADQPLRKAADESLWQRIQAIINQLQVFVDGAQPFTVVLDDPSGNSYIENLAAPKPDPQMSITKYIRSDQQCQDIGIDPEAEKAEREAEAERGNYFAQKHPSFDVIF